MPRDIYLDSVSLHEAPAKWLAKLEHEGVLSPHGIGGYDVSEMGKVMYES
jgi:hypothetical protein